jgi:hypothetical protein
MDSVSNRVSCSTTPVRGSIPLHERKFSMLRPRKSVRPELAKGEERFCVELNIQGFRFPEPSRLEIVFFSHQFGDR